MQPAMHADRWHELLNSRFVCEACLTRYFQPYRQCPACHQFDAIRPLVNLLLTTAGSDNELRAMIARGQRVAGAQRNAGTLGL